MNCTSSSSPALVELVSGQRGFTPLGLILRAVRGLLPAQGLVVLSAVSSDPFDLLVKDVPSLRCMRFNPQTDERADDLDVSTGRFGAAVDPAIRLSDVDIDLEQRSLQMPHDGSGPGRGVARKWRRLDGMFGSRVSRRQELDGLVICEPGHRALRVLRGGLAAVRSDRPLIAMPISNDADGVALLDLLEEHGYSTFDPFLQAARRSHDLLPDIEGQVTWVLALPSETAFPRIVRALCPRETPPVSSASEWNELIARQLRLEVRSGGIRFESEAVRRTLELAIGWGAATWGIYPPEISGDTTWSWIGPRPRAGIVLPPLATRLDWIHLDVASTIDARNVSELCASIDGEPVQVRTHWKDGHGGFDLIPKLPELRWRPFHVLEISVPVSRRPHETEPRMLALSLHSVTLHAPLD